MNAIHGITDKRASVSETCKTLQIIYKSKNKKKINVFDTVDKENEYNEEIDRGWAKTRRKNKV